MNKNTPIPHDTKIKSQYSMWITSYNINDYYLFYSKTRKILTDYTKIGYEIILCEYGINHSSAEGIFYMRFYMNDSENVGTIIPTLGNTRITEELQEYIDTFYE